GSRDRVDGIMWDDQLTEQRDIGIPPIGRPVAVTAKVGIREYEQEDDEGNITLVKVRQLTARRIDVVDIHDPISGSLPTDVTVPQLNRTIVVEESTPAAEAPEEPEPTLFDEPDFTAPAPDGFVP